jgi:hypothetical protein
VEVQIGSSHYLSLILFLFVTTTAAETIARKLDNRIKCSLGFSGVLFGVSTYEIITFKKPDYTLLISTIIIALIRSNAPNTSFLSHLVGIVAGGMSGIIWNSIYPVDKEKITNAKKP